MPARDAEGADRVTALVTALAECYQRGRRYRAIAERCEQEILGRALAIAGDVRHAHRTGAWTTALERDAATELAALAAACAEAIAAVRHGALYARTRAAWHAADDAALAALLPELFAGVAPVDPSGPLFVPVPIVAERGSGDHFLAPGASAARVAALAAEGLTPPPEPPDLGADDEIRAIALADDAAALGAPLRVAVEPAALGCRCFRVEPFGDVLVYRARLRVPFTAEIAAETDDEWWATHPDGWARWRTALAAELAARGIAVRDAAA